MLATSVHLLGRRRRRGFLGAISLPNFSVAGRPMLTQGGGIEQPPIGPDPLAPGYTTPTFPGSGGLPPPPPPPKVKGYWFSATVGPTSPVNTGPAGDGTGGTQPPPPQTPAGTVVNEIAPPAYVPPPVSTTPDATVPTADVVVPGAPRKPWWPWAIAGAVVAAVGAYAVTR